jgi:hypothetical protein
MWERGMEDDKCLPNRLGCLDGLGESGGRTGSRCMSRFAQAVTEKSKREIDRLAVSLLTQEQALSAYFC